MSWNALALSLELRGDIHCGDLPLGFVARTHPFVPCHIPFFALVPAAVEKLGMPSRHDSYVQVEKLFNSCLRSTPLFVTEDGKVLFPWQADDLETLEGLYLGSRYGVALEGSSRSAVNGRLYETEVILAAPRGRATPTALEGVLFVREGETGSLRMNAGGTVAWEDRRADLPAMLSRMHLGGDRTRALGLPAKASLSPCTGTAWDAYPVDCGNGWPVLEIPADLCGPMPVAMNASQNVQGSPLVLTGRRHTEKGAGTGMDATTAAYAPGWKLRGQSARISLSSPRFATLDG